MESAVLDHKLEEIQQYLDLLIKNYHLSLQSNAALKDEIKALKQQMGIVQRRNQKASEQIQKMIAKIKAEVYD